MATKKTAKKSETTNKTEQTGVAQAKASGSRMRKFLVVILLLALSASSGYFGYQYFKIKDELSNTRTSLAEARSSVERLTNPAEAAKEEVRILTEKVGSLVDIPKGETPTLATVSDPAKLKEQAFFTDAQAGDKVLVFVQAKRAVLYRPSTGKVVQAANVTINDPAGIAH